MLRISNFIDHFSLVQDTTSKRKLSTNSPHFENVKVEESTYTYDEAYPDIPLSQQISCSSQSSDGTEERVG